MNSAELFDLYLQEKSWSNITTKWARARAGKLFDFIGDKPIDGVSAGDFNRFMAELRSRQFSWSLRNGTYTVVAGWWKWLTQSGYIKTNFFQSDYPPPRPRKEKRVVKPVAAAHIITMLKYLDVEDTVENKRNKAIIYMLALTGMRRMELVGLKLSQVDLNQGLLYIVGKFGNERIGFIAPELLPALNDWLAVRPKSEYETVFLSLHPSKKGVHHPLAPDAINKIIEKVKTDAGIGGQVRITPHMFRHFFASEAAKASNPFALMKLLGHSDIKTTEIYVDTPQAELKRVSQNVKL